MNPYEQLRQELGVNPVSSCEEHSECASANGLYENLAKSVKDWDIDTYLQIYPSSGINKEKAEQFIQKLSELTWMSNAEIFSLLSSWMCNCQSIHRQKKPIHQTVLIEEIHPVLL